MAIWPKQTPNNIIVRMPNWIGDFVMATPVLEDLRAHYPQSIITAMCPTQLAPLLQHNPHINEILSYRKLSSWVRRFYHAEVIDLLQRGSYDLGVLLTNSFSSACWFWRAGVSNRIGFRSGWRSLLLNKAVPFPEERETQHLVLTYKALLTPLGIRPSSTLPKLYLSPEERSAARELLMRCGADIQKQRIIGINPGAAYGSAKCWLPERFQEVTRRLLEDPAAFILYFGDGQGAPLIKSICAPFPERVIDLSAKTSLRELIALIQCCSVLLTNDSGPMHIAAALGTPIVALFGSTSEIKTGPYPKGVVIHKHVSCSPCYRRVCPIDFRCMKQISSEEVFAAVREILDDSSAV